VRDPSVADLIVALAPRDARATAAPRLARALGAGEFILLVRDAELGVMLPAPGFAQTLRGGPLWRAFVERCGAPGRHVGQVDLPAGESHPALAVAIERVAAVFVGGEPEASGVAELARLLPLLRSSVCAELDVLAARAAADEARRTADRAQSLAIALEAARAEGAKLNAELREEHRRKDDFLAMLSHELRNPLTPLVTSIEILRRGALQPADVDRQLDVMARQINQLTRLVEDLLDVSRVRLGRIALRRQPLALGEALRNAVDASRPLLEARHHTVRVSITEEPLPLNADYVRLTQVFANLMHNAAKYTDPGGCIEVSATREEGHAVVRFSDNGVGMSPEFLPRVFDLFAQAPVSLARSHGGLGIGLTLVRSLIELHGGDITAASPGLGRGSTFTVRLPIASATPMPARAAEPAPIPGAVASLRVLVVDDNVDAADTLAAMLRLIGHHVQALYSGAQALQVAGDLDPDLVFLDIGLPDMDGFEVMRRLRRLVRRQTWCVALTGYGSEETRRRCRDAGFDEHMVKPASLERLAEVIERAVTERDGGAGQGVA
jgi:signal transduction histidine kinase/ActR/RegA family two-component response regulator